MIRQVWTSSYGGIFNTYKEALKYENEDKMPTIEKDYIQFVKPKKQIPDNIINEIISNNNYTTIWVDFLIRIGDERYSLEYSILEKINSYFLIKEIGSYHREGDYYIRPKYIKSFTFENPIKQIKYNKYFKEYL